MLSWRPEGLRLVKAPLYRPDRSFYWIPEKHRHGLPDLFRESKSCRCMYWCESPWSVYLHREEPRVEMNRVAVCLCWSWWFLFVSLQTLLHCCIPDKNMSDMTVIWVIRVTRSESLDRPDLEVCGGAVAFGSVPKVQKRRTPLNLRESKVWQFWPRDLAGHRCPLRPGAAMGPYWG